MAASAHEYLGFYGQREGPGPGRMHCGPGYTHTLFSTSPDRPTSPPTPVSFVFSALTSSFSVLISSDLLLADNNRNKEQHRFLACVCFFSPRNLLSKKKKSLLSFTGFYCFRKGKTITAGRTVTITDDISL